MQNYSKTKIYGVAGVFFLLWLGLHFFPGKISMFNFSDWTDFQEKEIPAQKYLQSVIDYHREFPAFARRLFSNFWFGLFPTSISGYSFVFSEWLAMVLLGILWLKRNGQNILPIILFFFSFPVLFAWFPSQYTFEEPFLWLFLFGFTTYFSKNQLVSSVFALLAILTRETALLFLLPWLWVESRLSLRWILVMLLGIVPYFFQGNHLSTEIHDRWELLVKYNFQNQTFSIETILYFFLTFFPTLFFLFQQPKKDRRAFLVLLLINTFLVFFGAKARESRLHLIPLFFILLRWKKVDLHLPYRTAYLSGILTSILAGLFFYSQRWTPSGAMIETVWIREYGILWAGIFGLTATMLIFGKSTNQK